ncbi:MAG TPA: hypothetical protein VF772_23190, partial [Terriglobales bacterium]
GHSHAHCRSAGFSSQCLPISGLTFLLLPKQPQEAHKAAKLKAFVRYVISDGQGQAQQLH